MTRDRSELKKLYFDAEESDTDGTSIARASIRGLSPSPSTQPARM
eukprot:CAMPEP_0181371940 /NCGR_PEP_ID=MMETSP1106-20121128/14417_1 /TAXON_ID=81844 /ORGANISM="Mantoniella antarctica, Strain SL-175" /LENGTH=44 /DNA_ID= /DNA_START= /DNA_END= /DNA_ORIENTATION=